jgi:hypothetical protein
MSDDAYNDFAALVELAHTVLHTPMPDHPLLEDAVTELEIITQIMKFASGPALDEETRDALFDNVLLEAFDVLRELSTSDLDAISDIPGLHPLIYGAARDAHERSSIKESLTKTQQQLDTLPALSRQAGYSTPPAVTTHTLKL